MKRCLIHIGMHKTGSTTIQKNLKSVRDAADWDYPTMRPGKMNMNENLFAMFAASPEKYHIFRNAGYRPARAARLGARLRRNFEKRVRNMVQETMILSSESLSKMDPADVRRMGDFLHPLFDEIQIFGYVRPPAGFMASAFQERVKHGKKVFGFEDCYPKYRYRFEKFDEVFGRENVKLVKFQPASFVGNCALREMCAQTGILLPEGTVIEKVNESLSREACGILFAYRKFGPGYGVGKYVIPENRAIIRALSEMGGRKLVISRNLVDPVLEANRADVEWMEERLGGSLREEARSAKDEVACEEDLLIIPRPALKGFSKRLRTGARIRLPKMPPNSGGATDPADIAGYVQACRKQVGRKLRKAAEKAARPETFSESILRRVRDTFRGRKK